MEVEVCMGGLMYIEYLSQLPDFLAIITSGNVSEPFVSICIVNLMFVCMFLKWC